MRSANTCSKAACALLEIEGPDLVMLRKMVERGWGEGDLADYLTADEILSAQRVLKALEIAPHERAQLGAPHSPVQLRIPEI